MRTHSNSWRYYEPPRTLKDGVTDNEVWSEDKKTHKNFNSNLLPLLYILKKEKKRERKMKIYEGFTLNPELSSCETFKLPALIVFSSSTQRILTCIKRSLSVQSDH